MNDEPPPKRRWITRKRLLRIAIAMLIFLAAVILSLPFAIREGIEYALRSQGQTEANIDSLYFNPFTATLELGGLTGGDLEEEFLTAGNVFVTFDWGELFDRRVLVKKVVVEDFAVHVWTDEQDHWNIGQINLAPREAPDKEPFSLPVGLGADAIEFRNVRVKFDQEQIRGDVVVEKGTMNELRTWTVDNPAPFDIALSVNGAPVTLSGETTPFSDTAAIDVHLKTNELPLDSLRLLAAEGGVNDLAGELDADLQSTLSLVLESQTLDATTNGQLTVRNLAAAYDAYSFQLADLAWDGEVGASGPLSSPALRTNGVLTATALNAAEAGQPFAVDFASANWNGSADLDFADSLRVQVTGGLETSAPSIQGPEHLFDAITAESFAVSAEALDFAAADETRLSASTFSLSVSDLALTDIDPKVPKVTMAQGEFGLSDVDFETRGSATTFKTGAIIDTKTMRFTTAESPAYGDVGGIEAALSFDVSIAEDGAVVSLTEGGVDLEEVRVFNSETGLAVAELPRADVDGLIVRGRDDVSGDSVTIEQPRLLQRDVSGDAADPYVAEMDVFTANGVRVTEIRTSIDDVTLDGLDGFLLITEEKHPETDSLLRAFNTGDPETAEPAEESTPMEATIQAPPYTVRIGRFEIEGDSSFQLVDQSVTPPAVLSAKELTADVSEFDTNAPDAMMPVSLNAVLGEDARISISGDVAPMSNEPSADMQAQLQSLDLNPFTGYLQRGIGYQIDSGVFGAETNLRLNQGQLDATNNLVLNELLLSRLDQDDLTEFDNQLGMPVNTAVNLLRDGDGTINLNIPVEGDLDNPEFRIGQVVRKGALNALKKSVLTVFAPLRIVGLGRGEKPLDEAMQFSPVVFEPGSSTIGAEAEEYLKSIGSVMNQHPSVALRLTGVATRKDIEMLSLSNIAGEGPSEVVEGEFTPPPLVPAGQAGAVEETGEGEVSDDAVNQLANERANAVKSHLVEEYGINATRLFVEPPVLDESASAGGGPRVGVSL